MLDKNIFRDKKDAWLVSFIDLTLLLTCFFILIYSALYQNRINHAAVFDSIHSKFPIIELGKANSNRAGMIYQIINKSIIDNNLQDHLLLTRNDNTVSILINLNYLDDIRLEESKYNQFIGFLSSIIYNFNDNKIDLVLSLDSLPFNSLTQGKQKYIEQAFNLYKVLKSNSMHSNLNLKLVKAIDKGSKIKILLNIYEKDNN